MVGWLTNAAADQQQQRGERVCVCVYEYVWFFAVDEYACVVGWLFVNSVFSRRHRDDEKEIAQT